MTVTTRLLSLTTASFALVCCFGPNAEPGSSLGSSAAALEAVQECGGQVTGSALVPACTGAVLTMPPGVCAFTVSDPVGFVQTLVALSYPTSVSNVQCALLSPGPFPTGATQAAIQCTYTQNGTQYCQGIDECFIQVANNNPVRAACPDVNVCAPTWPSPGFSCAQGNQCAPNSDGTSYSCIFWNFQATAQSNPNFDNGCTAPIAKNNPRYACCTGQLVRGRGAPQITVANPLITIWPPDHKYYSFNLLSACKVSAVDACGNPISLDATNTTITSISSDEPEDASGLGDGETCNDIVYSDLDVKVRAERDGSALHNGREYTIDFTVSANGSSSTAQCTAFVPHDQGTAHPQQNDGCKYCVGDCGGCPGHNPACTY